MVKRSLFFLVYIFSVFDAHSQKVKTDVLITGRENWAAAVQSANSAVKTTLVYSPGSFPIGQIDARSASGISAELLKKTKGSLSTAQTDAAIQKWLDTTKNLSLIRVQQSLVPVSAGSGWQLRFDDGRKVKARVLISTKAGAVVPLAIDFTQTLYRTSLASGFYGSAEKGNMAFINLQSFLDANTNNRVFVPVPEIQAAQAAGAIAAYAAFYKTKTSLSNLKRIQGELLGYKSALIPLADIALTDTNWRAIQNISLMGVLKPVEMDGVLLFKPQQTVKIEEVKQPLKDLFYKAQIWFDDNPSGPMTLAKTVSLICYVGNKSEEAMRASLEKKWRVDFKSEGSLDFGKTLSRRAFSILVNEYLKPADVSIDINGRITR